MRDIAGELEYAAEAEGHEPGTPGFERALLRLAIEKCIALRGAPCLGCPAQLACTVLERFRAGARG